MRGTVVLISAVNGLAAIAIQTDDYSIVEHFDELQAGDEVEGPLDSLGDATLIRRPSGSTVQVVIEDCHADVARVRELLKC